MSFNKRILTKEIVVKHLLDQNVSDLFKSSDAIIFMDSFSSKVYESYTRGLTDDELFNIFEKEI
jgi:hypothetical protein